MRLSQLRIKNFRSLKDSGDIRIESLQAFVGENNAGKSNILSAIEVFLTSGAGGVSADDYNDSIQPIVITATFSDLTAAERRPPLRKYLLGDKLILEKQISLVPDKKNAAKKQLCRVIFANVSPSRIFPAAQGACPPAEGAAVPGN